MPLAAPLSKVWSSEQKPIFNFIKNGKGNLVVRARAGTGKTTTIIEALNHIPADTKTLLAAFNKRIADELTRRISVDNVEAKTLHSLGFAYIRRQSQKVTVDATVDMDRVTAVCKGQAPGEMAIMIKKLAGLLKNISPFGGEDEAEEIAIDFDCEPSEEWEEEGWNTSRIVHLAIAARDAAKERDPRGRISFDDMIYIPLACDFVRAWYDLVIVDEAQDMNYGQLLLAQKACKKTGRIVVVGDDRQAIYGFRGAADDGINELKKELKATELGLTVTYRCASRIVEAVSTLVPDFKAAPGAPLGTVDSIEYDGLVETARPGDFVLSRKNAPLMSICLGFLRKGVPARIEGRDVGEGLRNIVKGFKAKSVPDFIKKVSAWEKKQVVRFGSDPKHVAKLEQVQDQAQALIALADGCASVTEIAGRLETLFTDTSDQSSNVVVCSSVHKAKGLETGRVFILRDTVSCKSREEQNIYYVAVTRAKRHLTWVEGKARR